MIQFDITKTLFRSLNYTRSESSKQTTPDLNKVSKLHQI